MLVEQRAAPREPARQRRRRLGVFATHPVQYHVPVWRKLAERSDIELKVFYFSDHNLRAGVDPGFGVAVSWDTPLLSGYDYEFLRVGLLDSPRSMKIASAMELFRHEALTHALVMGYSFPFERQVLSLAQRCGFSVLMRAEFSDLKKDRPPLKSLVRDLYLNWVYSQVGAFACIGRDAFEHLRARGIEEQRLFSSPYCIDTALFEEQRRIGDRSRARGSLGLRETDVALVFSGKLIPRKDPLLLLEAIRLSGVADRIALIIMGDGELKDAVLERGRSLLGSRLHFLGFVNQSQLGRHYAAADAFVLPSQHETWGVVVNEAMFFGLPVLVSDQVGSSRDLVVGYRTGFEHRRGDAHQLGGHIRWLVEHPEERRRMGEEARRHVAEFGPDAAAEGLARAMRLPDETPG